MTQEKHWRAIAVESGTNYTIDVTAPTKDEVDTKLYGRAYGPKPGSISYYRVPAPKLEEQK